MAWNRHAIALTQLRKHVASMAWGARSLISTQHKAVERAIIQPRVVAPLQDELHISGDLVLLCTRFEGAPDPFNFPVEAVGQFYLELAHEISTRDLVDVFALALQL